MNRRQFIKTGIAASVVSVGAREVFARSGGDKIWANLLHLSFNMWEDRVEPEREMRYYRPFLRFDEPLWNDLLHKMAQEGMNMVVIDLGDGVAYQSHPEIAVENAWSVDKLKQELKKVRDLGLEPIPKLNFSTTHDAWLGPYSRCISTEEYYQICEELISEVIDIFDQPRFFHLGMDEETCSHQKYYQFVAVRQFDLWWHDFLFYCDQLKEAGVRPWIWSDYLWHHPQEFFQKMPKDVVQSNWYYRATLEESEPRVKAYLDLEQHHYDQIPTASNHSNAENFAATVAFCSERIQDERLLGFLQTPWRPTLEEFRDHHLQAIEQVGAAKKSLKK